MPRLEYRRANRLNPASLVLDAYRRDVTSQCGEDGIIERLFELIPPANRWCVEFGACDGKSLSNTWNLINNQGWTGVLIEGDRGRFAELQATYKDFPGAVHLLNARVGLAPDASLDAILSAVGAPPDVDLVSIDIDGNDWHIWNSLLQYRPRALVIEFNPTADNDVLFVQDCDPSINQGCSLLALVELGRQKGYELAAATPWNAFFVRAELFDRLAIADNSIDALYQPTYLTKIMQGFDGTVMPVGVMQLLWQGKVLTAEDFQVLPPEQRCYPGRLLG